MSDAGDRPAPGQGRRPPVPALFRRVRRAACGAGRRWRAVRRPLPSQPERRPTSWPWASPFALIAGLLRPAGRAAARSSPPVASRRRRACTISTAFVFAILLLLGARGRRCSLHGSAACSGEVARQRKPLWRIVFNTGQYVACLAVGRGSLLWPVGGLPAPDRAARRHHRRTRRSA